MAVELSQVVDLDRYPIHESSEARKQLVARIFSEEIREFYEIERLYQDVPMIDWNNGSK